VLFRSEHVTADWIVNHICAATVSQRLDPFDYILFPVIDYMIGTDFATNLELLGGACRGDYGCAEYLPHLHRGRTDPAGSAEYEQPLAG